MSQPRTHTGNGHVPPLEAVVPDLDELKQQLETLRLQHEIKTLTESLDPYAGAGLGWGAYVDPYEMYGWSDRYGDVWLPTGNARANRVDGGNKPFFWTDFDLDRTRDLARWLATKNDICIGALESLADYTTGFTYEAKAAAKFAKDGRAVELASLVDDVIQEFIDLNLWGSREWDACLRYHRDGETFIRCFAQDDGRTIVRSVEPEQVRQPLGSPPEWSYGLHTPHGDVENVTEYAVDYGNPDDWEAVPADEMSHAKGNVDSCVKRGLSDLFSVGDALDEVKKLLRNMRQGAAIQAAIAWYEMHKGADAAAVAAKVAAQRDKNRPLIQHPITGQNVNYQKFEPGSVVSKGGGVEIMPAPSATNVSPHVQVVQAALRSIATRWRMTESMISGDASNNNMASQLIAGAPFVVRIEKRQKLKFKPFFLRTMQIVVMNAAKAGRFIVGGHRYSWQEISRLVDLHATPPRVAIADKTAEWTIDNGLVTAGAMSLQTLCARHDLDPDQERANLREWPPTRVGGSATDIDPAGNPVKPGEEGGDEEQPASGDEPGGDDQNPQGGASPFAGLGEARDPLYAKLCHLREQYGEALAGDVATAAERLLEGAVKNKSGPGWHDSETGKPVPAPTSGEAGGGSAGESGTPAHKERANAIQNKKDELKAQLRQMRHEGFNGVKADAVAAKEAAGGLTKALNGHVDDIAWLNEQPDEPEEPDVPDDYSEEPVKETDPEDHAEWEKSVAAYDAEYAAYEKAHAAWEAYPEEAADLHSDLEALTRTLPGGPDDEDLTPAEHFERLGEVIDKAKEMQAVDWSGVPDFTPEEIATNKQRLAALIKDAKTAREHLRQYSRHRKEMDAIRRGETMEAILAGRIGNLVEGSPVENKNQPGHYHDSDTGKPVAAPGATTQAAPPAKDWHALTDRQKVQTAVKASGHSLAEIALDPKALEAAHQALAAAGLHPSKGQLWETANILHQRENLDTAPILPALRAVGTKSRPNPALKGHTAETVPPDLSNGEKAAQQQYSKGGDGPMNFALRQGQDVPAEFKGVHERLQSAFAKAKVLSKPVTVLRGMNLTRPEQQEQLASLLNAALAANKTGEPLALPGYTSTATGSHMAAAFKGNVEMRIAAVHGLDMMPVSHFPHENEFLLNHGSQFKVAKVERTKAGKYILHLEQLPPEGHSAGAQTQAAHAGKGIPPVPAQKLSFLGKLKAAIGLGESHARADAGRRSLEEGDGRAGGSLRGPERGPRPGRPQNSGGAEEGEDAGGTGEGDSGERGGIGGGQP